MSQPLTPKQKKILDFITNYTKKHDYSPSLEEIAKHFRLKAVSTVHQYIEVLKNKGYLKKIENKSRSIQPLKKTSQLIEVPLLGYISAGQPIEAIENPETIEVSKQLLQKNQTKDIYALRVKGNSMIEEGIFDGDIVIIKKQETAENGETVVALINQNEITLKKIFKEKNGFRLQPANPLFEPVFCKELIIQGEVITVIRNFNQLKNIINETKEFHPATIEYMKTTDINYRKSLGQYFTPQSIIKKLLEKLPNNIFSPLVLDPACGTGEFLLAAKDYFKKPKIFGWEIDKKLTEIAKEIVLSEKIEYKDSLLDNNYNKFDFVIGNPPYFEFSPSQEIKKKFAEVINGRINIFSLFIYQGIKWLKEGGYLAYVVPPSMNNGAYFLKLRKFIIKNSNIEYLHILNDPNIFNGALQSIMLIVLKKTKNKGNYLFQKNGLVIFSENSHFLNKQFEGKSTLSELNFKVRTGEIVWNQNKDLLTNNENEGVPLIWSHNINNGSLNFPILRNDKPQYIKINKYNFGPAIVVNRITGTVKSTKIKAALIPNKMKFIAENHVNVIFPPQNQNLFNSIPNIDNKSMLENIVRQLNSTENAKLIKYITGNTQISKTELENLIPLKLD